MTVEVEHTLRAHLLRPDGQENLCIVTYRPSTGARRLTAILDSVVLPTEGETAVHGNVSVTGDYVLRAFQRAVDTGGGVAIAHSHPGARQWQGMSGPDADAESSYANLVRETTGRPLVGMTLAGEDGTWSARFWDVGVADKVSSTECESIRVIGDRVRVSWNDRLVRPPEPQRTQARTVSCWGPRIQRDIARLRILVVGAGTLGLEVALRLAATGIVTIAVLDFDSMKLVNLDRMIGPTILDVLLRRSKVEVAMRLLNANATALPFEAVPLEGSVCDAELFKTALDFDVIFCCVDDHPWPRSVLNAIAYSDLIPVIDGGVHIDAFCDGDGMRNATWRSHVLRPGRPCMSCNGQLDLGKVLADRDGLLDDEVYISGLAPSDRPQSQNVALLAISAAASLLAQFVSFVVAPGSIGEPGPLRYNLSTHWLERVPATTRAHCPIEDDAGVGDQRQVILGEHHRAKTEIHERTQERRRMPIRAARHLDAAVRQVEMWLTRLLDRR
jgi:hypothetical protein